MEHQKLKPSLPARLHPTDRCAPLVGNAALHGSTRSGSKSIQECRRSIRFFVGVEHRYIGSVPNAFARTTRRRQRGGNARKKEKESKRDRDRTEGKRKREERKDGVIKTSTVFLVALYRTRY